MRYDELQCGQPCKYTAKGVVKKHNSKPKIKVARCYEEIRTGELCERCSFNSASFEIII